MILAVRVGVNARRRQTVSLCVKQMGEWQDIIVTDLMRRFSQSLKWDLFNSDIP